MNLQQVFLAATMLIVSPMAHVFSEEPPLSKEQLDAAASLIVTGRVTDVRVGEQQSRPYGNEYTYDLTILVQKATKGNVEIGSSIVARGVYISLKPGYVGSGGQYANNTFDRMNSIEPGWELVLHLSASKEGIRTIVGPNGFVVLAKPPQNTSAWPLTVGTILIAIVAFFLVLPFYRRSCRY